MAFEQIAAAEGRAAEADEGLLFRIWERNG